MELLQTIIETVSENDACYTTMFCLLCVLIYLLFRGNTNKNTHKNTYEPRYKTPPRPANPAPYYDSTRREEDTLNETVARINYQISKYYDGIDYPPRVISFTDRDLVEKIHKLAHSEERDFQSQVQYMVKEYIRMTEKR